MDSNSAGVRMREVAALQSPVALVAALVLVALVLYRETVASLLRLWTDPGNPTYHHGLVLVGVCAYLLYRRWKVVGNAVRVRPSAGTCALVLLISLGWLLASLVDVLIVQQLCLAALVWLLIASVVGFRSARFFALPVGLLLFALPVWEPLNPYLQRLTAKLVTSLVNLSGISAFLEGTRIWVPAGTFDVEPQCSGLAQLIVGTMAGALFAYTNLLKRKAAIGVVVLAAGVSLLVNALRVYIVVVAGELTAMKHYFITTGHWTLGWVLFGVAMFIYLLAANAWIARRGADAICRVTEPARTVDSPVSGPRVRRGMLLSLGALALGPLLLLAYRADLGEGARPALDLPARIEQWQAVPAVSAGYRPVFYNPDQEQERVYADLEGAEAYVYVAAYVRQEQGREAVYYLNKVYDDEAWTLVSENTRHVVHGAAVHETRIRSGAGREKLVWQWYYLHGTAVSDGYMAKLVNALRSLQGKPDIAAVVVAVELEGRQEPAVALLTRFVEACGGTIERAIDHVQRR